MDLFRRVILTTKFLEVGKGPLVCNGQEYVKKKHFFKARIRFFPLLYSIYDFYVSGLKSTEKKK